MEGGWVQKSLSLGFLSQPEISSKYQKNGKKEVKIYNFKWENP
jgi:hypothetical protein